MNAVRLIAAIGLAAMVAGCAGNPRPTTPREVIDRALEQAPYAAQPSLIVAREVEYARAAREDGQWTAFSAFATDDAVLHGPIGPVAAKAWLAAQENPEEAVQWGARTVVMSCDGRLAISQAISGNSAGFASTLAPLVEARDAAAIRTRAFGLAIMGEQERAEGIVNAAMPPDLASRINPYLAYMPRLTASQQAAAANLGIFPRAADIGREDPRIARFAREGAAGSRLEPAGEPFGASAAQTPTPAPAEVAQATPTPRPTPSTSSAALPQVATREAPSQPPARVADAFADLGEGELPVESGGDGAVNIAAIEVPRETPPPPPPAEPEHPRRIWVQLATGRDVSALRFDWRRLSRKAPELLNKFKPHVTPWGQANRLLAGPVASRDEARDLVNALAGKGIETFSYTSPEGTEIQELK